MLELNVKMPEFILESSLGGTLSDAELLGKYAVIVFYPRNNTPG